MGGHNSKPGVPSLNLGENSLQKPPSDSAPATPTGKRVRSRRSPKQPSTPDYPSNCVILQSYQKSLLRQAWTHINKSGSGNIGSMVFKKMMNSNTEIKQLFQHVSVFEGVFGFGMSSAQVCQHHSGLFVELIDFAMANLDDMEAVEEKCYDYGEKHAPYAPYGFQPQYWDRLGVAISESSREWEGWRRHRETLKAWNVLNSFLVDRMRHGYEGAVKKTQPELPSPSPEPQEVPMNVGMTDHLMHRCLDYYEANNPGVTFDLNQ